MAGGSELTKSVQAPQSRVRADLSPRKRLQEFQWRAPVKASVRCGNPRCRRTRQVAAFSGKSPVFQSNYIREFRGWNNPDNLGRFDHCERTQKNGHSSLRGSGSIVIPFLCAPEQHGATLWLSSFVDLSESQFGKRLQETGQGTAMSRPSKPIWIPGDNRWTQTGPG